MFKVNVEGTMVVMDSTCSGLYEYILQYAANHSLDVMCTDVRSAVFADICLAFQNAGYSISFEAKKFSYMNSVEITKTVAVFRKRPLKLTCLSKQTVKQLSEAIDGSLVDSAKSIAKSSKGVGYDSGWLEGGADVRTRLYRRLSKMM